MADQLYTDGDTINHDGTVLEATAVSYQENENGEKHSFSYTFRSKDDLDAERKAEEDRLAEEQRQQELQEQADAEPEPALPQGDTVGPEVQGWGGSPDLPPSEPVTERKAPDDYAS